MGGIELKEFHAHRRRVVEDRFADPDWHDRQREQARYAEDLGEENDQEWREQTRSGTGCDA